MVMTVASRRPLLAPRAVASGPAPVSAPFSLVNGPTDGPTSGPYEAWSVTYASQPTIPSPVPFTVTRQGYDATASVATITDTLYVTTTVRQPYPSQASQSALTAALSDYIYSTDTIYGGATNNSTFTSPTPVFNWVSMARSVVGNTVHLAVTGAHRNARSNQEVACVKFTATDGVLTVSQIISTTSIDVRAGDAYPIVAYVCDLDITTLAAGLITCNAEVYPWIGAAASVFKSVNQSANREFSPRYYLKNTTLAANPVYAYLDVAGSNSTGLYHTTAATASATPFLTIAGALDGIVAARNTAMTNSLLDGLVIRIKAGTFNTGNPAAAKSQNVAWITIERDPTVARASCIVQMAGTWAPTFGTNATLTSPITNGAVRFHDVTINRTAGLGFQGNSTNPLSVYFDDVTVDNAGLGTWLNNGNTSHDFIYGMTLTNIGGALAAQTTGEHRIIRGVSVAAGAAQTAENWLIVGCYFNGVNNTSLIRTASGGIFGFTYWTNQSNINPFLAIGGSASADVAGFAMIQNIGEFINTEGDPLDSISADNANSSNTHICVHNNTFAGAGINGRSNWFYDYQGTARSSKLMSVVGNVINQLNTKSDIIATNGARIGNWAFYYGVGCVANLGSFAANSPTSEAQIYTGQNSNITITNVGPSPNPDPLFTTPANVTIGTAATSTAYSSVGTTATITGVTGTIVVGGKVTGTGVSFGQYIVSQSTGVTGKDGTYIVAVSQTVGPVAGTYNAFVRGAGNGVYTVGALSPAKAKIPNPVLAFDIAGTSRLTANDTIGAYA